MIRLTIPTKENSFSVFEFGQAVGMAKQKYGVDCVLELFVNEDVIDITLCTPELEQFRAAAMILDILEDKHFTIDETTAYVRGE